MQAISKWSSAQGNQSERNLFIWASELEKKQGGERHLVAGTWNEQLRRERFTVGKCLEWLYITLSDPLVREQYRGTGGVSLSRMGRAMFPYALVWFAKEDDENPLRHTLPGRTRRSKIRFDEEYRKHNVFGWERGNETIPNGHFFIVTVDGPVENQAFYRYTPGMIEVPRIFLPPGWPKIKVETDNENKGGHSEGTRWNTRARDRRCRITGAIAHPMVGREPRFTALETAHGFPIEHAHWRMAALYFKNEMQLQAKLSTKKTADVPSNTLILRVDVHRFFDACQIGFHPSLVVNAEEAQRPVSITYYELYRFEKNGAYGEEMGKAFGLESGAKICAPYQEDGVPVTREQDEEYMHGGPVPTSFYCKDDIDLRILDFHFEICLLWNFAGAGRYGRMSNMTEGEDLDKSKWKGKGKRGRKNEDGGSNKKQRKSKGGN